MLQIGAIGYGGRSIAHVAAEYLGEVPPVKPVVKMGDYRGGDGRQDHDEGFRKILDYAVSKERRCNRMETKVINGKLHFQNKDGSYSPVPLGMDDARSMKNDSLERRLPKGGEDLVDQTSAEESLELE